MSFMAGEPHMQSGHDYPLATEADRWSQRNMPLTTTEVPTFFGPSDSPLFGVVHLPVDNQIRGGVLICGSLGKEGIDSVRLHRILADSLACRGFGVLCFDYLGLGDSAYAQVRDDAVANWVASVGHALDYLTLIGAESTTAIGVRAGCLILDEYLARSHTVNRVVYLDPYGTGRRYLREHTMLFRMSVGEDVSTPGEVSIIGGRLSDHAAAEFAALRMGANPVGAHRVDNVLLVGRPAETDKRVTALASAEGVDSIITGGLAECARPRDVLLLPIPCTAVDSIIEWIDGNVPTRTHRAVPQYLTTVTMPAEGPDGVDVFENIERIEPNGLFAIRTLPRRHSPAPAKTVLFFVMAKDLHVGPTREWVELSRRIAAAGSQAVRWDPAGLGLSGQISRDPWRSVFSKADITDSTTVARHACQDAGKLELVGICSGSWYAAHVARNIGAQSAILVNLLHWNWRVTPTLLGQWHVRRKSLQANRASDIGGSGPSESRTKRLKAILNAAREPTKNFMHNHLPRYVLRVLSWVGLVWLPEDILTTLAHRGTNVTLIASPEDAELFTARGGRAALDRLQWTSQPARLIATPTGDHAAHHPAILAAIRNAVLPAAAPSPSEHIRVSDAAGLAGTAIRDSSLTAATPGGRAMTRRHDPAWVWMIGAFGGALALAVVVLAAYGTGPDGLRLGVRATARWSFLFFWLSYAGGAMAILFGPVFAGLARGARAFGLAFATALQVHIGLVVWLGVVIGQIPLQGGLLWFFLVALFFTYLLVLLSFGIGMRNLGRLWRPLLFLGTTFILIAFGRDFVLGALDQKAQHWLYAAEYVPFALLSLMAIPLRLAAFLRQRFGLRSAAA